jgi:hypothetical protein
MKSIFLHSYRLLALAGIFAFAGQMAQADTLVAYPTVEEPTFTISVPEDWELTPAEEAEDYFLVTSPDGAELWFKSMEIASEDELSAAVDEAIESGGEWLAENYKDVELGEVTEGDREGMPFVSIPGIGVYTETGEKVVFTIAFIFMENGSLAEFWGILPAGDESARGVAQTVLDSFVAK